MKICFCIGKLKFSGAENVVRFLAEELIKRGHEISIILLEKMPEESEKIPGLICENAIVTDGGLINVFRRIKAQRKALKKLKPDVFVIFNFAMAFTAVPATFFMKGLKVVTCERNDPVSVPKSRKRRIARDVLFALSDACISQTEEIAKYFGKLCKNNYVIPNPLREKGQLCPPVEERKKVFATVARLDDYQKNQTMMIKAFANVVKNHPEYELHFLGAGEDLEKYNELVQKLGITQNVKFLGNVPEPLEYIKTCRVFLLSSNYEGMPNALIEAMSIGLPCISTDCLGGGASSLIVDGVNGFLVARNDEEAFSQKMELLINDEGMCNSLGNVAYEINDRLIGSKIADIWESILLRIING